MSVKLFGLIGVDIRWAFVYNNQGYAAVAQSVERVLGKDEVTGSIPVSSSR